MEQRHKAAQWFFDFAYKDLLALSPPDLSKEATYFSLYINGLDFRCLESDVARRAWEACRTEADFYTQVEEGRMPLILIQQDFRSFIEAMFENLAEKLRIGINKDEFAHNLPILLPLKTVSVSVRLSCYVGSESMVESSTYQSTHRWVESALKDATIFTRDKFENDKQALRFQLLRSLDGLPYSALGQCFACGKRFVNLSRRKKTYCSNKCAARYGARKRRARLQEEDPERAGQERAAARERANASYKRRVQVTHPKAKVARRSRVKD